MSPLAMCRLTFGIDAAVDREWWRRPTSAMLELISNTTGIDYAVLETMTLRGWSHVRDDERADRFGARYYSHPNEAQTNRCRLRVCQVCMKQDGGCYLRLLWMNGWVAVCPTHQVQLTQHCAKCRRLNFRSHASDQMVDLTRCPLCGLEFMVSRAKGKLVPFAAVCFQQVLLTGKRCGQLSLPQLGSLDWSTAMALTDVLLGIVWTMMGSNSRKSLFTQISRDLGAKAGPGKRDVIHWNTNYGGLLILTWLMEDWERAMRIMIPARGYHRHILARMPNLSDEMAGRLSTILAPAERWAERR
jgi:hypothetical protein